MIRAMTGIVHTISALGVVAMVAVMLFAISADSGAVRGTPPYKKFYTQPMDPAK